MSRDYDAYIVYGWKEPSCNRVINSEWLNNNNIDVFTLNVYNNKPKSIIYGLKCGFSNDTGKSNELNDSDKLIIQNAFDKIKRNHHFHNYKLKYFIGLETEYDYNYYYKEYTPNYWSDSDYDSISSESDCNDTNDIKKIYFSSYCPNQSFSDSD